MSMVGFLIGYGAGIWTQLRDAQRFRALRDSPVEWGCLWGTHWWAYNPNGVSPRFESLEALAEHLEDLL